MTKNITVKEIVKKWLMANKFDGLYCDQCGCETKDLMPCCEGVVDCEAGYYRKCDPETCPANGDCEWHIGAKETK